MMKKIMIKQKYIKTLKVYTEKLSVLVLILVLCGLAVFPKANMSVVKAASVQDQINGLQQQNKEYKNTIEKLQGEATSFQNAIAQLKAQIDTLQGQIDANTQEQNRLQQEIVTAEQELAKQKKLLGENIKAMYLEGEISTLEMLASSKDLSEFVDKEQYRNSVEGKIRSTLEKITALKFELTAKKEGVETLLKEQQTQQSQLADSRSEQNNLLSYNEGQQADFNSKTKENQKKINGLIESQRRANFNPDGGYYFLRFAGSVSPVNADNYPYRNAGFGMSPGPGCVDNDGPDAWGYCTRQCVSYTAWAVAASGRSAPLYYGNARDWVAAAYARGVEVSRVPEPGDVAISTSGYWGHAMYVESVSGSTFSTTEYNTYLNGTLSRQTRNY